MTDTLTTTEIAPAPEPVEAPVVADAPVVPAPTETLSAIETATRAAMDEVKARARDEQGRFVPKTEATASTTNPAQPESSRVEASAADQAPKAPRTGPPPGWTPEAKAEWPSMSPAQQAAAHKREDNYEAGISKYKRDLETLSPVKALLDENAPRFARLNVDAPTALRQLFTFQDQFERDPASLIRHIANTARIDLRQLAQTPTASASPAAATPPARPNVAPDVSQIVEERLNARDAQRSLAEFESNPANKHAKDPAVRQAMAGALAGGATNLTEAYDRAIWSLPHLRETLMADREATAKKAAADKVAAAQKAAIGIKGGSPNGARPASFGTVTNGGGAEGAARAAMAALRG